MCAEKRNSIGAHGRDLGEAFDGLAVGVLVCKVLPEDGRAAFDLICQGANESAEAFLGLSRREMIGARASRFIFADGEARDVLAACKEASRTGMPAGTRCYIQASDRILDVLAAAMEGGRLLITLTDVTARLRSQEQVNSLAKFPSENPNPVLRIAADGKVLYANKASEPLLAAWGASAGAPLPEPWRHHVRQSLERNESSRHEIRCGEQFLALSLAPFADEAYVNVYGLDITDRKQVEATLAESESRYRLLAENTLDVIWVMDMDQRFTYVNPAIEAMTGFTQEEWVGTRLSEHCTEAAYAEMLEVIQGELDRGPDRRGVVFETEMLRKDGTEIAVEIHGMVGFDENGHPAQIQGTTRGITERRLAEGALRRSEEKYRRIVEAAQEGIWVIDAEARTTYVNDRMAAMLGCSAAEMDGASLFDFMDEDGRQTVEANLARRQNGICEVHEFTFRRKDGSPLHALLSTSPLRDAEGRYLGAQAMVTDITDRKELEDQLRQSQKMEAVGHLAGGVAHDFRNHLMVMKWFAQRLLERVSADPKAQEEAQEIIKAADRSTQLTGQLLLFSRQSMLAPAPADLTDLLADIQNALQRMIGEDIRLSLEPSESVRCVNVDANQFQQAVINLVINARDAMPQGGAIFLNVEYENLGPWYAERKELESGPHAVLTVRDTGRGMDEATKEHIFEPFFTTKAPGSGTGLGLSMVYGFVKQSGGAVEVDSRPGEGTVFRLYFPVVQVDEAGRVRSMELQQAAPGSGTVLLVEDDCAVREIIERFLARGGYEVLAAADGVEAMGIADGRAGSIDLLLADVVMPALTGVELAEKLRQRWPDLPVVLMTGYAPRDLTRRGLDLKGVTLLVKPFQEGDLLREVARVMA